MSEQGKLFEEAKLSSLPSARECLASMANIWGNELVREQHRIAAARLYLEKLKDVIDDGSEGGNIEITFTVRKSGD